MTQGGAFGESVKASLALQTKTVNRQVVMDCEDTSVCERQAAEVNPSGHGISAVIQFLAGLDIERIKHSRVCVQQSPVFSTFLLCILSGRKASGHRPRRSAQHFEVVGIDTLVAFDPYMSYDR